MLEEWEGEDMASDVNSSPVGSTKPVVATALAATLPLSSVVKLLVTRAPWSFSAPWRKESQVSAKGTGFLLENRIIITNAHVVDRCVNVIVQAIDSKGMPKKFVGKVERIAAPLDLAIISVEDKSFWKRKALLRLAEKLPHLDDDVTCVGFPKGGDNISVTRGVVSRIDLDTNFMLRIQIDAAINPGNSGGPVFDSEGSVVGVASSILKDSNNIGYIIPNEVVKLFLSHDCPDFAGISSLWIPMFQPIESSSLREMLQIPKEYDNIGIRVSSLEPLGPSFGHLFIDDVVLEIDGESIASDATVRLRGDERIPFWYLITRKPVGEEIRFKLLRKGVLIEVSILLAPPKYLVPRYSGWDATPSYFICGGLVFVPLSRPWLAETKAIKIFGPIHGMVKYPGQQIVVLSKVLAHNVNFGYHSMNKLIVKSFNGIAISNLKHLADLVRACKEPFFEFQVFETVLELYRSSDESALRIVLNAQECFDSEREILAHHMIAFPSSF